MGRTRVSSPKFAKSRLERIWHDPREQFIYSQDDIAFRDLAKMWQHVKGWSLGSIRQRAVKEQWVERRRRYKDRVIQEAEKRHLERDASDREKMIREASDRHLNLGKSMQFLGVKAIDKVRSVLEKFENGKMDPGRALSAISQLIPKGVDIERKALGLSEKIVIEHRTREIVSELILIVEKYVTDSATLENLQREFLIVQRREREEVDKFYE